MDLSPTYNPTVQSCPHCGGTSGFLHKFADVTYTFYDWEGVAYESNNDVSLFSRRLKCQDCNRVVERFVGDVNRPPFEKIQ